MVLVFIDMGKEYVEVALCVLSFLFNKELLVCCFDRNCFLYGIKSVAGSSQQNITTVIFYDRVDAWLSAIRKIETSEVIRLIIIAHQSLGTTYPQVSFLINKEI